MDGSVLLFFKTKRKWDTYSEDSICSVPPDCASAETTFKFNFHGF